MSGPDVVPSFPQVVRITSETSQLASVRAAVLEAARAIGFLDAEVSAVALAIDEAVTNVIRHGYQGSAGQPIEVVIDRVEWEKRPALEVTICDCGRQVDPAMIVGRDLEDVRPGGLGTHIIRTIMDEVEYSHRHPTGMQLRVLKVLKSPDQVASPSEVSGSKESS